MRNKAHHVPATVTAFALFAIAALNAGCGGEEIVCCEVGCQSEVWAFSRLNTALDQTVRLHVRGCRNGECGETSVEARAGVMGAGGGFTIGKSVIYISLDNGFSSVEGGPVLHEGPGEGDRWLLTVEYGRSVDGANGDVIEISVTDEDTGAVSEAREVVQYALYERNGIACREASFEFPPP